MEQREGQGKQGAEASRARFGARPAPVSAPSRPAFGRVPDSDPWVLRKSISAFHNVPVDRICLGAGVAELVNHITATLAWAGRVVAPMDADAAYQVAAEAARGSFEHLDPFSVELGDDCSLVCVVNPTNETGEEISESALVDLLQRIPATTTVVLDESYIQYAKNVDEAVSVSLMNRFANLIVLRTFSNAYGRGGLRVGYALACAECVALLESRRPQFLMSHEAQSAAIAELLERERLLGAGG
jgi:histidinol-phosphate aminotransferase